MMANFQVFVAKVISEGECHFAAFPFVVQVHLYIRIIQIGRKILCIENIVYIEFEIGFIVPEGFLQTGRNAVLGLAVPNGVQGFCIVISI